MTEITYTVPGMSCGHCKQTVSAGLERVEGVEALRAAIEQAGYEAA